MQLRFAEFFAGIGLVRLALEGLGWNCVFANDIDQDKAELYKQNFNQDNLLIDDIANVHADQLPRDIELVTACFPCIDLSLAGNRKGLDGKDSGTYWSLCRLLSELNGLGRIPPLLLIENVQGFLSSQNGNDLESALRALNELGYACDTVLVNASHFTPQSRPRLFIIGEHESSLFGVMSPHQFFDLASSPTRPSRLLKFILANPHLNWGFIKFPKPPKRRIELKQLLEDVPPDSELWWDHQRTQKLIESMRPIHKGRLETLRSEEGGVGTVYRRTRNRKSTAEIRTDGLAGCLRTPRGGSSKQFLIVVHNGNVRVRNMTPKEYARLQGVPERFDAGSNVNKALFGFGDAVCVPAVRWVARHAFKKVHSKVANV